MAEMMSKELVSNLVVLVVAMALMANYFVSCENSNIGDVGSDHPHPHPQHNDGSNVKEGHDLATHPHDNGNRKMEAPDQEEIYSCYGEPCVFLFQNCKKGCFCLPVYVMGGICVGGCCP
ncbi:hypothetical protein FNV43_RR25720 [Rhamnella rubrinervis]|uniref:Uncharacterized protein n=1 Tax=Rhamnella rubrinervis TaxID=2594499 RepID=A0A8K0GQT2_9ROSA|nr:hypothetical protein FNV43_RR25720 [Rhamnella rubrinervis]